MRKTSKLKNSHLKAKKVLTERETGGKPDGKDRDLGETGGKPDGKDRDLKRLRGKQTERQGFGRD